jgi:predicted HTH domain antitoxin
VGRHQRNIVELSDAEREERLEQAVAAAEQALIEFEIAVETFRVEVDNFARIHHQRLGPMYARLDELDALIAEATAVRTGRPEDVERAREARRAAQPMPDVDELFGIPPAGAPEQEPAAPEPPRRVRPGKEAQRLYRELVRQAHPDLAQDPAEQERRGAFIARVNDAYARGDEDVLQALAREWAQGPAEPEPLHGVEVLYARLEWLAARQEALTALRSELEESAIGSMLRMAPDDPDALLNEIAEQLLAQVAEREARLAGLRGPVTGGP